MTPERWERVCRIFEGLRELDADARERELDAHCGGDTELRHEVAALLHSSADAEVILTQLAVRAGIAPAEAEDILHATGRRIGTYRLLRLLGRGGMGVVYLAERADAVYTRQVAIKLLPLGLETPVARARFTHERTILAQLDHAHIAHLLDGGVTPEGTPYYVMEHVDGEPLDDYCEMHRLDISARLDLFEQVCDAVAYAHRNLVIHRDIKPSNILVTPDGTAKLLDFGVAKLLDPEQPDDATVTRIEHRPFSPTYAAPELLAGGRVTTACDVYALGMVLYRLLAGTTPFETESINPLEWMATVRDFRPEPPSRRCIFDASWCNRLRGDLDTIVLKALNTEPDRRYPSVQMLQDDIRRHRTGQPVTARQDGFLYRAGKFWQRHRLGTTLTTLLILSIVTGLGVSLWQAREAGLARDRAESEAARARGEAKTAQRVARFLGDLFMTANPERTGGAALTAREILDRGVNMIQADFADNPGIRAELQLRMGAIYTDYKLPQHARPLLEQALTTRRELLGPDHPDVAAVLHNLGGLEYINGNYEQAGRYFGSARRILEKAGSDPRRLASALNMSATVKKRLGRYTESIADYEQAVRRYEAVNPQEPDLARTLNNLGLVYTDTARYDEAITRFERALAIHETNLGPDHPMVAGTLSNIAEAHRHKGELDGVEAALRRALAIMESNWGLEHPNTATAQATLGRALADLGKLDEAESMQQRSLAIRRRALGPTHPYTAYNLNSLGHLQLDREDPEASLPYFRRALEVRKAAFGDVHPDVADSLDALSAALARTGRHTEALDYAEQALAMRRGLVADGDVSIANALLAVAELRARTGDCTGAARMLAERIDESADDPPGTGPEFMQQLCRR